jgi:hypothetical protein
MCAIEKYAVKNFLEAYNRTNRLFWHNEGGFLCLNAQKGIGYYARSCLRPQC